MGLGLFFSVLLHAITLRAGGPVWQGCGPHRKTSHSRKAMIAAPGVRNTVEDKFTVVLENFKEQI